MVSKRGTRWERLKFRLYYRLWVRWVFHGLFNDEDALMVDVMDAPPERLYRPDIAITEWRKLVEARDRSVPQTIGGDLAAGTAAPESAAIRRAAMPITHRFRELISR